MDYTKVLYGYINIIILIVNVIPDH